MKLLIAILSLLALIGTFLFFISSGERPKAVVLVQGAGSMVPIDLDQSSSEIAKDLEPEILPLFLNRPEQNGAIGQILIARPQQDATTSPHTESQINTRLKLLTPIVLFQVGGARYEFSTLNNENYEPIHDGRFASKQECISWLASHIKSAQGGAGQPPTSPEFE